MRDLLHVREMDDMVEHRNSSPMMIVGPCCCLNLHCLHTNFPIPFQENHCALPDHFIGMTSDSFSCDSKNTSSLAGAVLLAFLDTTCGTLGDSYQL
jgi:hypothetical protein